MADASNTAAPAPAVVSPPAPANPADLSPQDRWLASQRAADQADPHRRAFSPNNDRAGERISDADYDKLTFPERLAYAEKFRQEQDGEGEATPPLDGKAPRVQIGDLELSHDQIRELAAFKAEADLKKASIPPSPDKYEIKLSADLRLPPGVDFSFDMQDPTLQSAREWAHRNQLTPTQFQEALGLFAAAKSNESLMIATAAQREREALGVTGGVRVDAITTWLKANYPEATRPMLATLATKAQVEFLESVIMRLSGQGAGSFRNGGREVEPATLSDEAWNKMTYSQQLDYSRNASARAASSGRR